MRGERKADKVTGKLAALLRYIIDYKITLENIFF
jgi:hypothetical protein